MMATRMIPRMRLLSSLRQAQLAGQQNVMIPALSTRFTAPSASKFTSQRRTLASVAPTRSKTIPELDLSNKTILVTGAARGLGLCMAQALLESGATIFALDRLPDDERSPAFKAIQDRAKNEWGTELHYRQIDVRNVDALNETIKSIADQTGRMDGLVSAAGIQQETKAIDYSAEDANRIFEVSFFKLSWSCR